MVVATCSQRLYGIVKCADFLCGRVIRRKAIETKGLVYYKFVLTHSYEVMVRSNKCRYSSPVGTPLNAGFHLGVCDAPGGAYI